jgi:hypothetical protein
MFRPGTSEGYNRFPGPTGILPAGSECSIHVFSSLQSPLASKLNAELDISSLSRKSAFKFARCSRISFLDDEIMEGDSYVNQPQT